MSKAKGRIRIPRDHPIEIEDDTSHLWAVSYADFLMVLLSFFVLFFSIDDQERESLVKHLSALKWDGKSSNNGSTPVPEEQKVSWQSLRSTLGEKNIKFVSQDKESLILKFPDNLYPPGAVALNKVNSDLLKDTLVKLEKYWPQIEITFIGHADSQRLSKKHSFIRNNHDLSALRASRALQLALDMGIPEEHLVSEGWGALRLNSRSLSLLIRPYDGQSRQPANFSRKKQRNSQWKRKRQYTSYKLNSLY